MLFTAEEWSVAELGRHVAVVGKNIDDAFLNEVHLGADRALSDDVVTRLKHLVMQFCHHLRHEVRVGVSKKRNGRNQRSAVVIDDLLWTTVCQNAVVNQTGLNNAVSIQIQRRRLAAFSHGGLPEATPVQLHYAWQWKLG